MFPRKTKLELKHLCHCDRKVTNSRKFVLPSKLAEALVHFLQTSPTSRSRYCTDYLYDLKGINKEYAYQWTNRIIVRFWHVYRSLFSFYVWQEGSCFVQLWWVCCGFLVGLEGKKKVAQINMRSHLLYKKIWIVVLVAYTESHIEEREFREGEGGGERAHAAI